MFNIYIKRCGEHFLIYDTLLYDELLIYDAMNIFLIIRRDEHFFNVR